MISMGVIIDLSNRERSLYLGLMEVMWAIAAGIGPLLGGVFAQYVTWRWVFWINLPVSGIAFVLILFSLDVHNPKTKIMDGVRAVDWFGSLSFLALTIMVLLGLNFGGVTFAWKSPQVICLIVVGALCSLLFVYSEKRLAKYPLMPLYIFTRLSNAATLLVTFAHGFVSASMQFYYILLTWMFTGLYCRRILYTPLPTICPWIFTAELGHSCPSTSYHGSCVWLAHRGDNSPHRPICRAYMDWFSLYDPR